MKLFKKKKQLQDQSFDVEPKYRTQRIVTHSETAGLVVTKPDFDPLLDYYNTLSAADDQSLSSLSHDEKNNGSERDEYHAITAEILKRQLHNKELSMKHTNFLIDMANNVEIANLQRLINTVMEDMDNE